MFCQWVVSDFWDFYDLPMMSVISQWFLWHVISVFLCDFCYFCFIFDFCFICDFCGNPYFGGIAGFRTLPLRGPCPLQLSFSNNSNKFQTKIFYVLFYRSFKKDAIFFSWHFFIFKLLHSCFWYYNLWVWSLNSNDKYRSPAQQHTISPIYDIYMDIHHSASKQYQWPNAKNLALV